MGIPSPAPVTKRRPCSTHWAGADIDITGTFLALENEGVAKFEASRAELADTVNDQLAQVSPAASDNI